MANKTTNKFAPEVLRCGFSSDTFTNRQSLLWVYPKETTANPVQKDTLDHSK